MSITDFLLLLGIGLILARILGELFEQIGLSTVLGEITAGILLGPSFLSLASGEVIKDIAEIGILLLLFVIGLELDFEEITRLSKSSAQISVFETSITFSIGCLAGYLLGLHLIDWRAPFFLGLAFMPTSIGLTARTLSDMERIDTFEGRIILSVAVFDDVICLFLLVILSSFFLESVFSVLHLFYAGAFVLIMIFLMPIVIRYLPELTERAKSREFTLSIVFGLLLIFSTLAVRSGLATALGAFLAGLAFRNAPKVKEEVHSSLRMFSYGLFLPIFFFQIGLSTSITLELLLSLMPIVLVVLAISAKLIGVLVGGISAKIPKRQSLKIGTGMLPRAEIILVTAEIAFLANIFNEAIFSSIVIIVVVTTLITPLLLKLTYEETRKAKMT